jgi:uncharacterized membrane protein
VKRSFKAGLIITLPLVVTIILLNFVLEILTGPFFTFVRPYIQALHPSSLLFLSQEQVTTFLTHCTILLLLLLSLSLIGLGARLGFIRALYRTSGYLLHKIPGVNLIYKTLQDLTSTLFGNQSDAFKQVVIVPFPPGSSCYAVGFITKQSFTLRLTGNKTLGGEDQDADGTSRPKQYLSILIPTTPNPTTGFLFIYEKKDVIYTQMRVEDAFKFIVSFGVIHSDSDFILLNTSEGKGG